MKEIEAIIRSFNEASKANKKTVLATVVHVEGSSYRRPGARMLVTEDGELTGAISGGCLEGDALRKALLAISQQQNKLVTYNTMDEEDNSFGIQLGCNGVVHILFEPIIPTQKDNPVALLEKILMQKKATVLVTFFSLGRPAAEQTGTCLLATTEKIYGSVKNKLPQEIMEREINNVFNNNTSVIKKYAPGEDIFIEFLPAPVALIIAGAGNDIFPLMEIAAILGWHTTIVDGRKTHANNQRFKKATAIIVGKPAEVVQQLSITEQTIVVLMSHNYNYDLGMLRQLIQQPCKYIGVLGPKKKLEKMLIELQEEGITITEKDKEKIFGPVGLDIGAETAEEIALSIMAEIKAVIAKKDAAVLRYKKGSIHDSSIKYTPAKKLTLAPGFNNGVTVTNQ